LLVVKPYTDQLYSPIIAAFDEAISKL